MMKRRVLCLLFMACVALSMWAQARYATTMLQEIGEMLERRGCQLSSPGTFPMSSGTSFGFYELRIDDEGKISHLGIPILNREMAVEHPSPVYDFVERYLLQLSLLPVNERARYLKDDKVTLDFSKAIKINRSTSFSMTTDEKGFSLVWGDGKQEICRMNFPKDVQLIYGKNKIEIERDFLKGLNLLPENMEMSHMENPTDETVSLSSDSAYYIHKGNNYILKEINSDTYFVRDEKSRLIPLYDMKYPSETISNLFNSLLKGKFVLNITQRMYGKGMSQYAVSHEKLYAYCVRTGCQPYVGIEAMDENSVKAVVVYENDLYGYNHLLYVDVDLKVLQAGKGLIAAEIYCYIPTYNLKSLFQPNELKDYEN